MLRPSHIDLATEQAYLASVYTIFKPDFTIKINQFHPDLDEFLIDNNAFKWAFISAFNPYSKIVSKDQNEENHFLLKQQVNISKYYFVEGEGKPNNGSWFPEKSLFILGINEQKAVHLAQQFQQNAIVVGAVNQKSRLVWCMD